MERFLAIYHRQDKISSVAQILLLEPFFFFLTEISLVQVFLRAHSEKCRLKALRKPDENVSRLGEKGQAGFLTLLSQQCSLLECTSSC